MSAELLARRFASTRGVLANVTPEQLEGTETSCASRSVWELVDHSVNGTTWFAAIAETGTPPGEDAFPPFAAENVVATRASAGSGVSAIAGSGGADA